MRPGLLPARSVMPAFVFFVMPHLMSLTTCGYAA